MPTTFDPAKEAANLRKHGVSLAEGDGVLNDPLALTIGESSSQGEQRFVSIRNERVREAAGRRLRIAR